MRDLCPRAYRLALLTGLVLCLACSAPPKRSGAAKSKAAQAKTQLFGKLLGHDGKPMPLGHVTIDDTATQVASDGSFRVAVEQNTMVTASFTGVDHGDYTAHMLMPAVPVELVVKLGTYEDSASEGEVSLVQIRFADDGEIALGAVHVMTREADGVFRASVPTRAGAFAYEIRGTTIDSGRSMNGSARTKFRYDGDGNYCNVVEAPGGALVVEHDPRQVNPAGLPTRLLFANPNAKVAQIAAIFDPAGEADSIESRLSAVEVEQDEQLRHARSIALFATLVGSGGLLQSRLQGAARVTLASLPAHSPLWNAAPTSVVSMANYAGSEYTTRAEDLVRRYLGEKDKAMASRIAMGMLVSAARDGDDEGLARSFALITKEVRDRDTTKLAQLFHPARKIRVGKNVPNFSLPSADGPETFSKQSFRGKVLLIDFWATWCVPCIEELPNLHATYKQFHELGFEILSINVDDRIGRSQEMRRRSQFPMPWSNVVLEKGSDVEMKRRFEVASLPTMILVDGAGRILATGPFVRGPALGRQVRAALAAQKNTPLTSSP